MKIYPEEPDAAQKRQDADEAITWARGILRDKQTLVLDIETTGRVDETSETSETSEICHVAVIKLSGTALFDTLVKPVGAFGGTDVHGAREDEVAGVARVASASSFADLWPELSHMLDGRQLLAWNADFHREMLHKSIAGMSGAANENWLAQHTRWDCIQTYYSQWLGEWGHTQGAYKRRALDAGVDGRHRALRSAGVALSHLRQMTTQPLSTEMGSFYRSGLR